MADNIFTITQLNNYIKRMLDEDDVLAGVYVKGELSNYKVYPSGHHYFSMKDAEGTLKCVMFKGSAVRMRFKPENGMSVVAFGKISVFPRDGLYQLYVNEITPDGIGDLYVAFEQLKEKLNSEGLFAEHHKKPLPRYPMKITVITSSAGAAVQDILRILGSRWPVAEVTVMPVRVQGVEAPPEIAEAIEKANVTGNADIIITGRGGGSIEDLWAFNDERVARAIFKSVIPVISAVGHEPDVTIADFVADVRASTPSNAAELAVPDIMEVYGQLQSTEMRLRQVVNHQIKSLKQWLDNIADRRILKSPGVYIDDKRVLIDRSSEKLASLMQQRILRERQFFAASAAAFDAMSPLKVLGRGYAIAERDDGTIVKSATDVSKGDNLKIRLQKDELSCIVS